MARINLPNLLSWYDSNVSQDFPRPFRYNGGADCRTGALITYPGDTTRYYINQPTTASGYALPGPSDVYTMQLINIRTNTAYNATFSPGSELTNYGFRHYGSVVTPSVPDGLYRWRLTISSTVLISSVVEVVRESVAPTISVKLDFAHSETLFGVRYPWVENTRQTGRIRAVLTDSGNETDVSTYRAVTTGIRSGYNPSMERVLSFKTAPYDTEYLENIQAVLLHDDLLINGRPVVMKDKLAWTPGKAPLVMATFTVYDNSIAEPLVP